MKTPSGLLLALLIASAVGRAQNILDTYNGSFESGLAQWRFFEVPTSLGSTAESVTGDAAAGTKSVRLTFVAPAAGLVDRGFDNWDTNVPVTPGAVYTASVQAKLIAGTGVALHVTLGFFDASRTPLDEGVKSFSLTSSYQTLSIARTAPAGAAFCWIAFRLKGAAGGYVAGTLMLDDVQLTGQGGTATTFTPRLMPLTLPSDDVLVASLDVTEPPYSAKADGSADATAAFQAAIDYTAAAGGGVIFVPAGRYRFDGSLLLKEKVMLRGDWQSPDQGGTGKGTILMVYGGQGDENGTPFLSMNRGSGIRNMTIWYPQQTAAAAPYPWTILGNPNTAEGKGDNVSVVNVTLVNPYQGIKIGPASNELHYVRNVYGTPLKTGIWLSQTTDIGRIINVHFEPRFWSNSGLTNAPSPAAVTGWTAANGEGIVMGRSDWEYMYDISLTGYKTGLRIYQYDPSGPAANGVVYGLHTDEGQVGVRIETTNDFGFAFTGCTINASAGSSPACVETGSTFTAVSQFNSCTFGGSPAAAVRFDPASTGRLTFQNCTFVQWGAQPGNAAIVCPKGSVAVLGSEFRQDGDQVVLGPGVTNAQILDNVYPTAPRVVNNSQGEIQVSQEPLDLQKLTAPGHVFAAEPRPQGNGLFVVTSYGAVGDKNTDNTAAFQAALDAAGQAGGGTVYIPAGWFRLNGHLTVPTGVELRGIWDVPHHTTSQGSILLAYEGKGSATGEPLIALSQGSGLRGFTVWYPEQALTPYPWTVQARGTDCWVKDVTLANSYQGVDMASYPSQGHRVSYLAGSPIRTGIAVSQNSGEGWVENIQFNPHYWLRSGGYPSVTKPAQTDIVNYLQANMDAMKFGACTREHIFGNFVYATYRGLYFYADGAPCNADVFLHGTDAGSYGVSVESPAGSTLNFINSQLVLLGSVRQSYIYTGAQFAGTAAFYNSLEWGDVSGNSADIGGTGSVVLQQINTLADKVLLRGGTAAVQQITMQKSFTPQFDVAAGVAAASLFANYCPAGFTASNKAGSRLEADYNYRKAPLQARFASGWETGEAASDWENTLYVQSNVQPPAGQSTLQCAATATDSTHALLVRGSDADAGVSEACFKVFKTSLRIFDSTTLRYRLFPHTGQGRFIHVDLLFTDGTRLTAASPRTADSLLLDGPRGTVGRWDTVVCRVGAYAAGKTVQTVLVRYASASGTGDFDALIDDLSITPDVPLPAPWQELNFNLPAPGGTAVPEGNTFFLASPGAGLLYAGDSFYYLCQKLPADGAVTARLDAMGTTSGPAFASVMIRESGAPQARFMQIGLSAQYGVQSADRIQYNSGIQSEAHIAIPRTLPLWFKVTRKGTLFRTYTSSDGATWTGPLWQQTVGVDSAAFAGLAFASGSGQTPGYAQFSSVSVSATDPLLSVPATAAAVPAAMQLAQNYPNPFNPTTLIRYGIPAAGPVELALFDVTGQKVRTLVSEPQAAGSYSVVWDARNDDGAGVASGLYFYRLQAGGRQMIGKMMLLR